MCSSLRKWRAAQQAQHLMHSSSGQFTTTWCKSDQQVHSDSAWMFHPAQNMSKEGNREACTCCQAFVNRFYVWCFFSLCVLPFLFLFLFYFSFLYSFLFCSSYSFFGFVAPVTLRTRPQVTSIILAKTPWLPCGNVWDTGASEVCFSASISISTMHWIEMCNNSSL